MKSLSNIEDCLKGNCLHGDTFCPEELEEWYRYEAEGYADLGAGNSTTTDHTYSYAELNRFHGFSRIGDRSFQHALGLGSAFGHEFNEITGKLRQITIIEPSEKLVSAEIAGLRPTYVKPNVSGDIPFPAATFDLVTSFGTLHHIANVTHVVRELARVTVPGGVFLLREPCVSLGDWRQPRKGLTKNERGIPPKIMLDILRKCGWQIQYQSYCVFPLTGRLGKLTGSPTFNNWFLTRLDYILANGFRWNWRYHSTSFFQKIRPLSLFIVAERRQECLK